MRAGGPRDGRLDPLFTLVFSRPRILGAGYGCCRGFSQPARRVPQLDSNFLGEPLSTASDVPHGERWRVLVPLFVGLWLTYAYGAQSPFNDNGVSRMALAVCAAAEGRVSIEPFQNATVDRAFRDGHYYSDKAPGLSLAAVPIVAGVLAATGGGSASDLAVTAPPPDVLPLTLRFAFLVLIATALLNGGATALAACAVYLTARRLGRDPEAALIAALAFALGTPAWGWATAFFGHALAGALGFMAFALTISRLERSRAGLPGWMAVGLLLGYSVLTEYPLAIPAAIIMGVAALGARRYGGTTRAAGGIALGASVPAAALLAYNYMVSGSWSSLPYEHVVGWDGMRRGFLGVTFPHPQALWGILLSERRGLVWFSPICALVPLSFWRARRTMPRLYWGAALAIVLYFLLFNASYVYWDGGYSTGPRHLTPALAFACLPLAWAWGTDRLRAPFGAALAVSVVVTGACVFTTMAAPSEIVRPLRDLVFPTLMAGGISNLSSILAELHPELPFASGLTSLVPLVVLWSAASWLLWRGTVRSAAEMVCSRRDSAAGGSAADP